MLSRQLQSMQKVVAKPIISAIIDTKSNLPRQSERQCAAPPNSHKVHLHLHLVATGYDVMIPPCQPPNYHETRKKNHWLPVSQVPQLWPLLPRISLQHAVAASSREPQDENTNTDNAKKVHFILTKRKPCRLSFHSLPVIYRAVKRKVVCISFKQIIS